MAPNIAIVGCGAIAQAFYLPALAKRRREFESIWLIDPNEATLDAAQQLLPAERASTLAAVSGDLEYVIVASPNGEHFSIAREALERGAHVLIEKPFVIWPAEGQRLAELAAEKNRIIAINQTRRAYPLSTEIRNRIASNEFGPLISIRHAEGAKLNWPFWSGAGFARDARRTGVIMDMGVHVVDFYQYLFEPQWVFLEAIHDGFDGPEGLAEIRLSLNGAPVKIRLSRYQQQENVAHLAFEFAQIRIPVFERSSYVLQNADRERLCKVRPTAANANSIELSILDNFIAAGEGREAPMCGAASSLPVISILDKIYTGAQHYSAVLGKV